MPSLKGGGGTWISTACSFVFLVEMSGAIPTVVETRIAPTPRRNIHLMKYLLIDEIVKLAIRYGASRIAFLDLKITDRLRKHKNWIPTYDEYQKVMFNLMAAKIKYRRKIDVALDVFLRCQPLQESLEEAKKGFISCQAGRNRLSIDADGSVYPCNLVISDKKWEIGNILKILVSGFSNPKQ